MRTVTFSQPEVQKLLNDKFLCSAENIRGQRNAGSSFSHRPSDPPGTCLRGNGKQNVQLYFLTPAGEIYHVVTGYLAAAELVDELEWALAANGELATVASLDDRKAKLIELHEQRLKSLQFSDNEIRQGGLGGLLNGMGAEDALRQLGQNPANGLNTVLQQFSRREILADHRYCLDHPLITHREFRPEELVGSGTSFFGSTSFDSRR